MPEKQIYSAGCVTRPKTARGGWQGQKVAGWLSGGDAKLVQTGFFFLRHTAFWLASLATRPSASSQVESLAR